MTITPDNPPQSYATFDWQTLPVVKSPLPPREVLERLSTASKRGRMPGFNGTTSDSFSVDLFGVPWDRSLVGNATADGTGTTIVFSKRNKPVVPYSWAAALVLSVWPGVVLTDALIPTSWGWIGTHVYEWYLPLTIISNIWTWIWAVRKTEATTKASALESLAAVAAEVSGSIGR